jgi:phosphomannomutase
LDATVLKPLKVVVNSGNSAAGPTFNAIATALGQNAPQIEFIRVHHQPDHTFSNGISNPLLPENHAATADVVMENDANLGVAFDGDFDRCFFLDEKGQFIDGEYIVGVLAYMFLDKVPEASIIHDPCIIWNTQSVVAAMSGNAVQSKRVMRSSNKSCAKWMQFMVVKCRPTIIFAILPIVTAA